MAISESVDNYLDDARAAIRSALVVAARNERPSVIKNLSEILHCIDFVKQSDEVADTMETFIDKIKKGVNGNGSDGFMFRS